jgi:hypothetical protein
VCLLFLALALCPAPRVVAGGPALSVVPAVGGEPIAFTLDDLAAMPQVTIVTHNEFTHGEVAYRGPLMRDVLGQALLSEAEVVRLTAANDYFVDIPTEDFNRFDVILAMEADGEKLSRRDKGPLWLMYPIADHSELSDPRYIHRLIWQVIRIEPQ